MKKISFFNTIKVFTFRLFIVLILSILFFTNNVLALSAKQKQIIDSNSLYLDDECTSISSDSSSNQSDSNTANQSLRDKLAQMLMPRVDSDSDFDTVTGFKVGGIFVGRDHITELSSKIDEKQSSETPMLVSIDGEGGTVDVPIGSNPPSALEMGSMSDEEVKNIAKTFGQELHDLGVNMDLAPVADVVDDTSSGVIMTRSFGNNNDTVIAKAGAFAEGLKESKILPTFKHFPGHGHATTSQGGSTLGDSHSDANVFVKNKAQLANEDLVPFVELSQSSPSAIMMGHLIIPDVDADTPATVSKPVITDLLRGELGYDGLVITDDMGNMAPITSRFSNFPDAVLAAIKAGNDMVLFADKNDQIGAVLDKLEQAVESEDLSEDRIDESLARINKARDFGLETDALSGCECTVGGGGGDFSGSNNVEIAYNYFTGKGLTPYEASAIIGNFMQESSPELNPEANSGSHYGIAQWDIGGREANLRTFARETGRANEYNTIEVQLEFVWLETTGEGATPSVPGNNRPVLPAMEAAGDDLARLVNIWLEQWEGARGQEEEKRLNYAQQVLDTYGGGTGSSTASCGGSTINGLECPANLQPHPSAAGYFMMPDAPNGEYNLYGIPWKRYGSETLICALHTVGIAYFESMNGESKLQIGNLNTPYLQPSRSHRWGVANDQYADGNVSAATNIGNYSTDATVTLGKLWVDTGILKNIWWCPGDDSIQQILAYAASKSDGLAGQIKCEPGHANHFHVDIRDEFRLEEFSPSP